MLIDRPVVRLGRRAEGFELTAGAAGSFRRGHDPTTYEPDGAPERYDAVVATVPNDVFLGLLDDELAAAIGSEYLDRLERIEYHTALCLLLELDRRFSPFYWTNIADPELPFVGLVEHTNFVEPERYDGRRFLYVANYLAPGDELLELDADALLDRYTPGLRKVNPEFERSWVRERWLHREPAAQPIVTVGYREGIPPLQTGVPQPRARQHDADLPRGPRDQLRRAAGRRRRRGAAVAALEERLVRQRVVAAVAPGVAAQQAPARQHEPAQRSVGPHGLDRVVRARRQVLAAARERRRDEALVEADRREYEGAHGALVLAPAEPGHELGQRAAHPVRAVALGELERVGAGDDDVVGGVGQALGLGPERLAQHALDAVALDGAADAPRDRQPEARAGVGLVVRARERVEHEVAIALRAPLPVHALELGAARQASALGGHRR